MIDEPVLSQQDQLRIHRTPSSTSLYRADRFFYRLLGLTLKCFQETSAKGVIEANRNSRLTCSKQLLIGVIFIWFRDKTLTVLKKL